MTAHPTPARRGGPDDTTAGRALSKTPTVTRLREMQLLEAARAGDRDALGELLSAYQRRLYAVCYRMVGDVDGATDLTQESLVRIIEGLDSYDGRSRLSTWMIRVTMNCCLTHLRKRRYRRHASLEAPLGVDTEAEALSGRDLIETGEPGGFDRVEQAETRRLLARGLDRLDPYMRAMLVLRDLHELEYQQIADVLELPIGTVKSRLFRARLALRDILEGDLDEDDT